MRADKKNVSIIFGVLFAAFLFAGILLGPSMRTEAATKYKIVREDRSKTYKKKGKCKAAVHFDRIVLKGNTAAIKKINKQIKEESIRFLEGAQESGIYENAKYVAKCGAENEVFYYTATSEVMYDKKNVISIVISTDWYAGGVGNTESYGLTFSLKSGKLLKLTNVCKGNESSIKKRIIKKAKKYSAKIEPLDISVIRKYKVDEFRFYLNKKGKVVICFEPYEVASGGWGRELVINSKY